MNEIRTVLTELTFTSVCKNGTFTYVEGYTRVEIPFTKLDMKILASGEILTKNEDGKTFKFILSDIGLPMIKEILKRSTMYSDMYYEL